MPRPQTFSAGRFPQGLMAAVVAALAFTNATPVQADAPLSGKRQALLVLHSAGENEALNAALPQLENRGCKLWRRGGLAGTQGSLDLDGPGHFALFACEANILDTTRHRAVLAPMLSGGTAVKAIEGPILDRRPETASLESQQARSYVLKISRYNNLDPDSRDRDLEKINAMAAGRADAWTTEAQIAGLRAVGMATPDEVVLIHYDDPQQGQRFRSANPDIMKQIGAFNRKHLIDFTYLSAPPADSQAR